MQAKPVFLLNAVVGLFFGISLMLVPGFILNLLDVTDLGAAPILAQHTGSWVFASSVFAFLIRNLEHSDVRQASFIFFGLAFALMTIVEIYGYVMALAGVMVLTLVALHSLLVILYTYLFVTNR